MIKDAMAETKPERAGTTAPPRARRGVRVLVLNFFRELTLVPVIVVLMIAGAIVNPVFFTSSNLINRCRARSVLPPCSGHGSSRPRQARGLARN